MTRAATNALPDVTGFEEASRSSSHDDDKTFVTRLRRFASEPLLHFAVLGALVFAGHRALTHTLDVHTLEVSGSKQRELAKLFQQRQHRAPSDSERQQLINRYVEDEALFREGQRLALVQTDPMLRAQLIARVRGLLQAEVGEEAATEAQLLSYYAEHRSDFAIPETISYREYLFPTGPEANDSARQLSLALQRGDEPNGPGMPPPTEYLRRSQAELSSLTGPDLPRRIWSLPTGIWRELSSSRGVHVVRVDEHTAASEPPFSSIHEQVLSEYGKAHTARAFQAEVRRLSSKWRVHIAEQP
jgi:hypothetical protein